MAIAKSSTSYMTGEKAVRTSARFIWFAAEYSAVPNNLGGHRIGVDHSHRLSGAALVDVLLPRFHCVSPVRVINMPPDPSTRASNPPSR